MSNRTQRLIRANAMITASIIASASLALAQEEEQWSEDVVVVTGIRGSIAESLDAKRNTDVVSDALIGVEIGDLPDLSIAESLERITGVTSDRFKGGASEVSIRGLGAFLSYSTLNGREITSGSDGRDVNFGQFPSELFEGVQVYKAQQASFVEGGVSGTIALHTLRPLAQINDLGPMSVISDFGNNAGLVIGDKIRDWPGTAIEGRRMNVIIDGEEVGASTVSPLEKGAIGAFRFLLRNCTERGITLPAGTYISTGAVTGVHSCEAGVEAEINFEDTSTMQVALVKAAPREKAIV